MQILLNSVSLKLATWYKTYHFDIHASIFTMTTQGPDVTFSNKLGKPQNEYFILMSRVTCIPDWTEITMEKDGDFEFLNSGSPDLVAEVFKCFKEALSLLG